jgi:hypothetical protein
VSANLPPSKPSGEGGFPSSARAREPSGSVDTRARPLTAAEVVAAGGYVDLRTGRLVLAASGPSQRRAAQVAYGEAGEAFVGQHHTRCALEGVAYITKRPTPWRVIGKGPREGTLLVVPEAVAGVDYTGWLLDGTGRVVVAEAKHTTDGRVDLAKQITSSQREELELAVGSAAVAVLLVVHDRTLYAPPWALVRALPSVTVLRDLGAFRVAPDVCWPACPWVSR